MEVDKKFDQAVERLRESGKPFAIATVINVKGSASAKPGSRAVIDETGKNVWGWVGGGCAESFVGREAVLAMEENRTRIVQADLDDEVFGLGMPCGGIMDVFIHPQLPPETLRIEDAADLESTYRHLTDQMGFTLDYKPRASDRSASLEKVLSQIAHAIGESRNASAQSLRETKGVYKESPADKGLAKESEFLILGSSRITEELARLATIAKWRVRVYGPGLERANYPASVTLEEAGPGYTDLRVERGSAVIIASHHKGDHEFIEKAIGSGAGYVGMIASQKRAGLVFEYLSKKIPPERLAAIHAPAGLELGCRTPTEIALSCIAELVELRA